MDEWEGGGGGDGTGGDADNVFECGKGDFRNGMTGVEVEEVGSELLVRWMGVKQVGMENHQWSSTNC